jgi:hypothetical protein
MLKRKFEEIIQNDNHNEKNKINEFDSNFFDNASKAWNSNKIKEADCTYKYKCTFRTKKNIRCNRPLYEYELRAKNKPLNSNCIHFCKMHINKKYNHEVHTFC